ncbi:BrnT family toxin [soil metagenome]
MEFEWDPAKAASNRKKHGVSFEEAETVFGDPLALIFDDETHSYYEKRHGIVGRSFQDRLLIVSFTERENDIIRIISARVTTANERRPYANRIG